ncbi:MAG TPA: DUF4136 domain-containing protein [Anaerolineales bacterium]|nr:DUF4136 domain-containing protein [Anaerolineales bacterium]
MLKAVISVLLLLTMLSAVFAASTKSDYQKDFDFGQLHTFAFRTERDSKDPLATNTIEAERIQNALAAQLEAKGFTQTSDNPDFIVAFYSRTKQQTRVNNTGFGYGPGFGWGYGVPFRGRWRWGFGPDIWTTTYTQGSVMADIIDSKTQELVWRGVVQDTVNGIGQSDKQANNAAKDLVQRFLKDAGEVDKRKGAMANKG